MSELDLTNIANTSISTPAAGVTAVFADTDKKVKLKNDAGTVQTLYNMSSQSIATAAGTTTLTSASPLYNLFTGATTQTVKLPDATTIQVGQLYEIRSTSTGLVTIQDGNAGALVVLSTGDTAYFTLITAGSVAGVWAMDPVGFWSDPTDPTKKIVLASSAASTATTLTLSDTQSTSQTLTIPNITAGDTIDTLGLAQTVTGVKTMTNMTTAAGTTGIPSMTITNGTNLTNAAANAIENDGTAMYKTINTTNGRTYQDGWNYFRLTGSGGGITTIADFFGANSAIPLVANGVYEIEWHCYFSQATAGTATWTVTTATTALANVTGEYIGSNIAGIGTVGAPQTAAINTTASSATAFPVTGTEATAVTHYFTVRVMVTAGNGSSNTRLRLTMSAGTATPLINSYFRVRQLSGGNVGAFVA